jgi:hypothetical protein
MVPEPEKKQSFWTTMPGILTGLAALLTAATGLWVAIGPHDKPASDGHAAAVTAPLQASAPGSAPPASTQHGPAANAAPVVAKESVIVTSRNGEVTRLATKSFRHGVAGKAIELTSGQTVPFEKIRSIDFETVSNSEVPVNVTLTDGRAIAGSLSTNAMFEGENDIGPFSIYVANVKRIVLQP